MKEGHISAILGVNGSGKSTLLRLISGLLDPHSGEILFEGKKVMGPSYQLVPGHPEIALVKQDNRLFPLHTVRQYLRIVLQKYDTRSQLKKIKELSNLLGFSSNLDRVLKSLSGGEQQRVSIAAALAAEPKLLLLDEPFSHTDLHLKLDLKKYFTKIVNQLGITLLFVTHDPQDALAIADEVIVIDNGKIIEKGNPKVVYYQPKQKATALLTGFCNWVPAESLPKKNRLHLIKNTYLIRPDQIQINSFPQDDALEAIIEQVQFSGFYECIYLLTAEYRISLMATKSSSHDNYQPGQKVWIKLKEVKY